MSLRDLRLPGWSESSEPPGRLLTWLSACAALDPQLDGLVLFDADADQLTAAARALASILDLATGDPGLAADVVQVGAHETDDDLWTAYRVVDDGSRATLRATSGRLVPRGGRPLVVVVRDLATASAAVCRAAVTGLGTGEGRVERHGVSARWSTPTYWIAGYAAAESGQVSPHLLDRFPLRIAAAHAFGSDDPATRVRDALNPGRPIRPDLAAPAAWQPVLTAPRPATQVEPDAVRLAIDALGPAYGVRRALALLRVSRATCRLAERSGAVGVEDVYAVARLIGIDAARPDDLNAEVDAAPPAVGSPDEPVAPDHDAAVPPADLPGRPGTNPVQPTVTAERVAVEPVLAGDAATALSPALVVLDRPDPYPEDHADPIREAAPLRLPWRRSSGGPGDRGVPVGVQPTKRFEDLAWVATLTEAAKFQQVRRRHRPRDATRRLLISATDLRQHRRAPEPDRLLVLVLDHTSRRSWPWVETLGPYLQDAYVTRTALTVIEVGTDATVSPLRAERFSCRSLLDPRVQAALSRRPGRSSPLAHGLDLARTSLRHRMQHGRAAIDTARLIVATDGLGNVPLENSLDDTVPATPVTDRGITDAFTMARAIGDTDGIDVVVVRAPGSPYPDIPLQLADAFGPNATVVEPSEAT